MCPPGAAGHSACRTHTTSRARLPPSCRHRPYGAGQTGKLRHGALADAASPSRWPRLARVTDGLLAPLTTQEFN